MSTIGLESRLVVFRRRGMALGLAAWAGWGIALFIGALLVGMWLERFIIVVVSLTRDFVPSAFGMYYPTQFDWAVFIGTLGFFTACMFLFLRLLPAVSISELKTLLPQAEVTVKHEAEVHS